MTTIRPIRRPRYSPGRELALEWAAVAIISLLFGAGLALAF